MYSPILKVHCIVNSKKTSLKTKLRLQYSTHMWNKYVDESTGKWPNWLPRKVSTGIPRLLPQMPQGILRIRWPMKIDNEERSMCKSTIHMYSLESVETDLACPIREDINDLSTETPFYSELCLVQGKEKGPRHRGTCPTWRGTDHELEQVLKVVTRGRVPLRL